MTADTLEQEINAARQRDRDFHEALLACGVSRYRIHQIARGEHRPVGWVRALIADAIGQPETELFTRR